MFLVFTVRRKVCVLVPLIPHICSLYVILLLCCCGMALNKKKMRTEILIADERLHSQAEDLSLPTGNSAVVDTVLNS